MNDTFTISIDEESANYIKRHKDGGRKFMIFTTVALVITTTGCLVSIYVFNDKTIPRYLISMSLPLMYIVLGRYREISFIEKLYELNKEQLSK